MSNSYADRPPLDNQQAAAAFQLGQLIDAVDTARAIAEDIKPKVWRFASAADAQVAIDQDKAADGDVLVIESERIVAFLVVTSPVAVTEQHGSFAPYGALWKPARDYCEGAYVPSVEQAEQVAAELGYPLVEPDVAEAAWGVTEQAATVEVPRLLVLNGDVLHGFGARLKILDTGTRAVAADRAEWWALVEGATEEDARRTCRGQWTFAVPMDTAAWDVVTVERLFLTPTA